MSGERLDTLTPAYNLAKRMTASIRDYVSAELRRIEPRIRELAREEIAAAVAAAKAARSGAQQMAAAGPTAPGLVCRVCTACHQQKDRPYFSTTGWDKAICSACEHFGAEGEKPEPSTPEWETAALLIPGILKEISDRLAAADEILNFKNTALLMPSEMRAWGIRKDTLVKLRSDAEAAIPARDHQKLHAIKEALAAMAASGGD